MPEFTCQVAGCCQAFDALEDYEHHYHTLHGNVCSSCKRAFPSGHLLDTHILEWHDSLFQILAERQDMVRDARPRRPGAAITGLVPEPCASRCQRLGSDWVRQRSRGQGGDTVSVVVPVPGGGLRGEVQDRQRPEGAPGDAPPLPCRLPL